MAGNDDRLIKILRDAAALKEQMLRKKQEREAREEQEWADKNFTLVRMLGRVDGYQNVNIIARNHWERLHNADILLALLSGGKADRASQRLAADIIQMTKTKRLPKRQTDRAERDRVIAGLMCDARADGETAGDTYVMIASIFGLSTEHVRKVALNKDLMKKVAEDLFVERAIARSRRERDR